MNRTFQLKDSEYIELIKLLKLLGYAENGAHAKMLVDDGEVMVNGQQEFRKRAKLRPGALVEIFGEQIKIAE